jgi:hypothetical protein
MAPLPRSRPTAPGRVDRLHEAALDAASETDRRWFLTNPGTGWYVRLPIPHEACLPYGRCLPERGYLIRCVELAPGARLRVVIPAADAVA